MYNYSDHKILANEFFMRDRFPPAARISPDMPITKLLDDAKQLKTKIDKDRAKAVGEDESESGGKD